MSIHSVPPQAASLPEVADRRAATQPLAIAYRFLGNGEDETGHLTYADLVARARIIANELRRVARPGERAMLAYPAGLDFPIAFLACLYAGVIAVPVELPKRRNDSARLDAVAENCGATLFLSRSGVRDGLPALGTPWRFTDEIDGDPDAFTFATPAPGDVAYLQYTSGSTRAPRGAAISHRALMEQLEYYRQRAGTGSSEMVFVGWLPHTHDFGLVGFVLGALYLGTCHVGMPPAAFLRRPARWLEAISRYRGAYSGAPAFGYEMCAGAGHVALRHDLDLSCWQIASLGGDYVPPATLERFEAAFAPHGFRKAAWLPAYGLAESVLCATGRKGAAVSNFDADALRRNAVVPVATDSAAAVRLVSCGTPMPGQHLRIVDPVTRAALPDAAVGEIWLAGRSLADGYWNDAPATASHFRATLTGEDGGIPHLRTGDLGFRHGDELFVTGRLKDLLVVRGENHAPDDVEATVAAAHPSLRPGCGAVVQTDSPEVQRLVVVHEVSRNADRDHAAVFAAINATVTERHGLTLDAIELIRAGSLPRTRNGKISRHACLAAFADGTLSHVARWQRPQASSQPRPDAARTHAIEQRMLAHLREMLPGTTIAADDNLFELGVDSLGLHGFLGRLNDSFGVDVPANAVFEAPTAARLAAVVSALPTRRDDLPALPISPDAAGGRAIDASSQAILEELRKLNSLVAEQTRLLAQLVGTVAPARPVAPDPPVDAAFALTETQREIRMLPELRDGAESVFNIMMVLEFSAPPNMADVRHALRTVTMRHEALRTVIDDQRQRVLPFADPEICEVALEGTELRDWLRAERRRPFALDQAPLWRVTLLRDGGAHLFVLTAHHLILDGSSMPILVREFVSHYESATPDDAAPPPRQFRAFCADADARRDAGDRDERKAYWASLLGKSAPDWVPPVVTPRTKDISYEAGAHGLVLDAALRAALVRRGAAASATLFQTLLCGYFVLLHRLSGQERILIGIDAANRAGRGDDGVIGCCNAVVPIVIDFTDTPTVARLQERVRDGALRAMERGDYTMTMWAEDQRIAFDLARPFKVTASMNMQRFPARLGGLAPRFDLEAGSVSQSPFGLSLEVRDLESAVRVDFVYNKQVFAADMIERLVGYFLRLLEAMAADADADILTLPMLPEAEARALLAWSRVPQPPAPFVSLLSRFAAQAAATPLAPAIACPQSQLSYRDLDAQSDDIARAIIGCGLGPGTPVALLADRGCVYLATLLAILKAGCVYLPLDPKAPDARLRQQIAESGAGLLLHGAAYRDAAVALLGAGPRPPMLCVDTLLARRHDAVPVPMPEDAGPDAPAYVLFTSGSSGRPKAAIVSHGGMTNHLQAKIDALCLTPHDVVGQTASQGFDISVWQYLAPLLAGGCVRVLPDDITHDPHALFVAADSHGITILQTVPSVLCAALDIMTAPGRRAPMTSLRWLISTGEALPAELCRRWISLYPRVPIMNAYGPTECSDDVTHHGVIWPLPGEMIRTPIGHPIPGAEVYVLNRSRHPVPAGAPGELFVGGRCVGLGYLNDPERTATAFVPDPFSGRPDARLYRTGDLVRFLDDGALDFLGRLDQQVKVNGVRVEPREIELALQRDPSVQQCLVTTRQGRDGASLLVAYVVLREGKSALEGTLKAVARNTLPQSMVPAAIVFLDALPLTPNGKIDLDALPEADLRPRSIDITPPSTPTEETVLRIWSEVIGPSRFGVHDDFFDLGGRSLDATRIIRKLENHFNFRIPLSAIFRAPTIAGFASLIDKQAAATK